MTTESLFCKKNSEGINEKEGEAAEGIMVFTFKH